MDELSDSILSKMEKLSLIYVRFKYHLYIDDDNNNLVKLKIISLEARIHIYRYQYKMKSLTVDQACIDLGII